MIDVQRVSKKFDEYVSNYNPENGRVKLKIDHIKRVAKNSEKIAKALNLNEEQTNLAIAIGYFHDIGRFEQVRIADTFSDRDSHINHGEMGVKILFENNLIRDFIPDNKYDEIIKKAVLNHNKPAIESGLPEETLLFCKIIRDADKLDIFYTITQEEYTMKSIFWYPNFDSQEISNEIISDFEKEIPINYSKIKSNADVIVAFYAYIYDLNFPISKKIVYENKYLDKFTDRIYRTFPSKKVCEQTKHILELSNEYLSRKS